MSTGIDHRKADAGTFRTNLEQSRCDSDQMLRTASLGRAWLRLTWSRHSSTKPPIQNQQLNEPGSSANSSSNSAFGGASSIPGSDSHPELVNATTDSVAPTGTALVQRKAVEKIGTLFSQFNAQMHKMTGYDEIEALKRQVAQQGEHLSH